MNGLTNEKNRDLVLKIRKRFLAEVKNNPQLYHRIDIERVRSEEWQIERFILDAQTEEDALKALMKAMQWKHSFGLHERNDKYFPKEFYLIFGYEEYSRDREDRYAIWVAHRSYKKMSDFSLLFRQFLGHQIEKLDRKAGNKGWVCVTDCSNAGLDSADIGLSKFRIDMLSHYPNGLRLGLNIDMPWIFKALINLMSKNSRDCIVIIKREQLIDYFDIDSVPISFGGRRQCSFEVIKDLQPLHELKYLCLTDEQINAFYTKYGFKK